MIVGAGLRGHVHAAPRPRASGLSARVFEAGERRRRHLVLEPLPGRALRRREHGVLVPVLRGAPAGVGVDRALRHAARDPRLREPRRRPLRPARATSSSTRACSPRPSTKPTAGGRSRTDDGDGAVGAVPDHGDRLPVVGEHSRLPRAATRFAGATYHTGSLAARGRRLHRQARRVIGTGSSGIQSIPIIAEQAARAHRVPAHRELLGARRTTRPLDERRHRARSRPTTPASARATA